MSPRTLIRTEALCRTFGEIKAVNRLSLEIPEGVIYGFLGPNGSGKSTTIRLICGLLEPTAGSIRALGYEIPGQAEQLKQNLGYMTQKFSLYQDLTVYENLCFLAEIQGVGAAERPGRITALMQQFHLTKRRDQKAGTMSGGQKQRLALACSIVHNPRLLILDEPTSAVDPESRREFWEYLFELTGRGMSILVSTHYMDEAERCHRLAILKKGRLVAEGAPRDLMDDLGARIILTEGPAAALIQWRTRLMEDPHILGCTQIGNRLRIMVRSTVDDPVKWLLRNHDFLSDHTLEATHPNLEDVFVRATRSRKEGGRTVRSRGKKQ